MQPVPPLPGDFVSPSTAVTLVGHSLYGEQWNGCPTLEEAISLRFAISAFREERTIARQRELWLALSADSPRTARQIALSDADKKAIDDEIEVKFAEDLARERRCQNAKTRLLELFCSALVTTMLVSNGNRFEVPCEFWASDQAGRAVDSGEASYNPAIYKREPFGWLRGHVQVPRAQLIAALEITFETEIVAPTMEPHTSTQAQAHLLHGEPNLTDEPTEAAPLPTPLEMKPSKVMDERQEFSATENVDSPESGQTNGDGLSPREKGKRETAAKYEKWYLRSKEIKAKGKFTKRREIVQEIAKENPDEKASNIRRRLTEVYPTWPD